jgi:hypothetical protein
MKMFIPAALLLSLGLLGGIAKGQLPSTLSSDDPHEMVDDESRYYESPRAAPTPLEIIQYKAQVRAQQRMTRMASMEWYGMSASRPRAAATPFTGMYSPVWQMPGGRPFAWTPTYHHPSVVIVR